MGKKNVCSHEPARVGATVAEKPPFRATSNHSDIPEVDDIFSKSKCDEKSPSRADVDERHEIKPHVYERPFTSGSRNCDIPEVNDKFSKPKSHEISPAQADVDVRHEIKPHIYERPFTTGSRNCDIPPVEQIKWKYEKAPKAHLDVEVPTPALVPSEIDPRDILVVDDVIEITVSDIAGTLEEQASKLAADTEMEKYDPSTCDDDIPRHTDGEDNDDNGNDEDSSDDEGDTIGIDLGTTYSSVGIWQDGEVEILKSIEGSSRIPSCVAFIGSGYVTGELAREQAESNAANTIYDVKRLIGRNFADPSVQVETSESMM